MRGGLGSAGAAVSSGTGRRALVLAVLGALALGAAALTGFWHPAAPSAAMTVYLPEITLPTVVVAAALDGINPCAFTVLLLLVTALLAAVQVERGSVSSVRARLLTRGGLFVTAIFLTYLALGVGVLKTADLFVRRHLPARIGALLAILLGLWMLKDYFLPGVGLQLHAPPRVGRLARAAAEKGTVPALLAGGFLIGLCTVPCSGAVYLGVLSLLAAQPTRALGYGYLLLYNVVFVLPLLVILIAAAARPTLGRLVRWNVQHREGVRLLLGSGVVVMGLVILGTV